MLDRPKLLELSQFRSAERPVVSLYINVDRSAPEDKYVIHLKNMIAQVDEQRDSLSSEAWQGVKRDMERAREWVRDNYVRGGESLAIFACGEELWETFSLPYSLPTQLFLDDRPRLRPLFRLLQRFEQYLTVLSDARDARVFLVRPDELREVGQVESDTPGRHDQGGWSQARLQRHQDKMVEEHLENAADLAFRLFQRRTIDGVVLMGTEERTTLLEEQLHPYLRERVLARVPMDMNASGKKISEVSRERGRQGREERRQAILDHWEEQINTKGGLGTAGLEQTVRAAQQGQLLTLLMVEDFDGEGGEDTQTGILLLDSEGTSDYSGAPIRPLEDIGEALASVAMQQDAEVIFIPSDSEAAHRLQEHGGVGAILRFATGG